MKCGVCISGGFDPRPIAKGIENGLVSSLISSFEYSRSLGYDFGEFNAWVVSTLSDEDFEILADFHKRGLFSLYALNGLLPGNMCIIGEQRDEAALKEYLEKVFFRAGKIGVKVVVFGSGKARSVPEGMDLGIAKEYINSFLTLCCGIAKKYDIVVAIEPLNSSETNVFTTLGETAQTVKELGIENLRLLADIYHMYKENEDPKSIARFGSLLAHIHIAQPITRDCPKADEGALLEPYKQALLEAGYDGGVSMECMFKDFGAEIAEAAQTVQNIFSR